MATRSKTRRAPQLTQRAMRVSSAPNISDAARPVLVATDGSRAAGAAIKFASTMARASAWAPEVLTVFEHLPIAVGSVVLPKAPVVYEPVFQEGVLAVIRRQLRRLG